MNPVTSEIIIVVNMKYQLLTLVTDKRLIFMDKLIFESNGNGTCKIVVGKKFVETTLYIPEKSPEGEEVTSIFFDSMKVEEINVAPENKHFSSFDGVLFNKDMTKILIVPAGKSGKFIVPKSVVKVDDEIFCTGDSGGECHLKEIVFQEGFQSVTGSCSLYGPLIITFPSTVKEIDEEAFIGWHLMLSAYATIRAPRGSFAHHFAISHGYKFMPSDCLITWNAESWSEKFHAESADYHSLRREVWENTQAIVEDNGYSLPDGNSVLIESGERYSKFYYKPFTASFEKLKRPPEITVVADDCLDVAQAWVKEKHIRFGEYNDVAVLNMANRRNPGGGVTSGAGAQEEYLFRCSDYYKFLYRYAAYAEKYGMIRSHYQYPLDRNYGGIFSEGVTIFRENETSGYRLTDKPWKVNMIAVAGMNSPRLIFENGEERISPELVEGVKNKIRTIFRIAIDRGQKNLVLGAIGCGAFHNPPKHVAELFREILCEQEFFGAFKKICFAVKTSHTSRGDTNFSAFKETLDGFIPTLKADSFDKNFELPIKKIAISRDSYALLKKSGEVEIVDIHTGKSQYPRQFTDIEDIAGGFDHFIGLRKDGSVVFKSVGNHAPSHYGIHWFRGIAVDACEGHSGMLKPDGTVLCMDQYPMDTHTQNYRQKVEAWENIKQIALTFDTPYALTHDGKILRGDHELKDFQDDTRGKIVQIAAFGCYYSLETIAALYSNGTVKAWCDKYIEAVQDWRNVKKICCGLHGAVIGLTNDGKIISIPPLHKTKDGMDSTVLKDIVDIAVNFEHLIALSSTGEIFYLKDGN